MMFNQHERRQLEQIEQQFEANDPRLAQALRQHEGRSQPRRLVQLALGGFGAVVVVLGVLSFNLAVVLMGAAVAGWALWMHLGERGMDDNVPDAPADTRRTHPDEPDWGDPPGGSAGAP